MVTKLRDIILMQRKCSVLAKILMVTKHNLLKVKDNPLFCSSKNPYGNKTPL